MKNGTPHPSKPPSKFGPPRPASDPRLELTVDYVGQMNCRSAGSIEARLMRDWLRLYAAASWTPVADRMPDDDITVLVYAPTADGETVWPGYHDGDDGWGYADGRQVDGAVTHWKDVPAGPDGGGAA